jgi:hypothetical protein
MERKAAPPTARRTLATRRCDIGDMHGFKTLSP